MGEPPGADRDLGAGQGRKWEGEQMRERHQAQARDAGRRDKWRKMVGGRCG